MSAYQPTPLLAIKQSFPQVLRTWGGLRHPIRGGGSSKFDGGLKSIHGGSMGGLKCCRKIPVKEFI